jgi:integrase
MMVLRRYPGAEVWTYPCQVNGRKWSRSTGETDKRMAQAKVPELEALAELHRGRPEQSLKFSKAMVAEVNRLEIDVSARCAERVHYALKRFMEWLGRDIQLEKIDTHLLEQYQRSRLQKVAVATVNRELYGVINLLRQHGFLVRKPGHKPGKKTEQRAFTKEELQRFFGACTDETHKTLFLLLLTTGARPAEVIPSERSSHVALLKKEVNLAESTVTIRTAKMKLGQRCRERIIRIPEILTERLDRRMQQTPGLHVFPANGSLAKLFDRIIERAKIPKKDELGRKVTAHSFRHTYATLQAQAVAFNPFLLKEIMGHCQISTTDRYCHPHSEALVIDVASLAEGGVCGRCVSPNEPADPEGSAGEKSNRISAS